MNPPSENHTQGHLKIWRTQIKASHNWICTDSKLVEAITFHSLDNLTLQVAATGSAMFILKRMGLHWNRHLKKPIGAPC
ncbi:MAG: hypothetical protein PVH84_17815, partial [Candidatus Aminicenantes bacterium]